MKRGLLPTVVSCVALATGCSVKVAADAAEPTVTNVCQASSDCGGGAICTAGACYAKSGAIDEVLLEVVPAADSPASGLSFLSVQTGVKQGGKGRDITLPKATTFPAQVQLNASNIAVAYHLETCDKFLGGKPTIPARIRYVRTGSVSGVPLLGLPSTPVIVETVRATNASTGGFTASVSLAPGTYDVYVEPLSTGACTLAPRILRGIDVPTSLSGAGLATPPATIELAPPVALNGVVRRKDASLIGWAVDVIEPQEGRVISTSAPLGATSGLSATTNFVITYQPLAVEVGGKRATSSPTIGTSALIRVRPPAEMEAKAPVVYWDLSAVDLHGTGKVDLDMSGVPEPASLVKVKGRVRGEADAGFPAKLQVFSTNLEGAAGLTASFSAVATTDAEGRYEIELFPGSYRVIATPQMMSADLLVTAKEDGKPSGANALNPWAITERQWAVTSASTEQDDLVLYPKRIVQGVARAGIGDALALGATLDAIPAILPGQLGILRGVLAQTPVSPQSASVVVRSADAQFSLPLDPGDFDISLRPSDASNFAWWVWPAAHIEPSDKSGQALAIQPHLALPIILEGSLQATLDDGVTHSTLKSAAVRAYAKSPSGAGVVKVGDARTDDTGHYRLLLPASFGP
ncbi:MAG TPA: hypothetical protein VJT73_16040 [Polyangiaceae bacterium]|nr:hypothetical protein [Polyangiaceae bacterium]